MKDAGYSRKPEHEMAIPSSASGHTKIYPSTNIEHKSMPHLKKHNVGDTGEMHVRYKVTGQRQYKNGEGNTDLEITHYEPAKRVKGKSDKELTASADKDEKEQPAANQE